jgi:hypothetical protein
MMTDDERIDRAKLRLKAAGDKRRAAPPPCTECKWCYGPEPGYFSIGVGQWCRNSAVTIDGNYDDVTGKMREAVNIKSARQPDGECGPNGVFFERAGLMGVFRAIGRWMVP